MALLHALRGAAKPLAVVLTAVVFCVLRTGIKKESEADVYNSELTPLQRHVAFFDRNKDGIIYPSETYEGDLTLHILSLQ